MCCMRLLLFSLLLEHQVTRALVITFQDGMPDEIVNNM